MTLNFASPTQNIVCFDLLNSSWEEIYANVITLDFLDFSIDFLKIKYDELHSENRTAESISKVYFEGFYLVSLVSLMHHDAVNGIVNCINYDLNEIKPITIFNPNSNKTVESIIDSFYSNRNLTLSEMHYEILLQINKDFKAKTLFSFEREIVNLELDNTNKFTVELLFSEFNISVLFEEYSSKLKINRFKLSNIFYRNQLPIAFLFKYYGKSYLAWNKEYLKTILNIKPINLIPLSKTEQLNRILDKINEAGLENLEISEKNFLDAF